MRSLFWDLAKSETGEPQNALMNVHFSGHGALNAYERLAEAEMRALRLQREAVDRLMAQSLGERRAVALERRAAALQLRDELRGRLRRLESEVRTAERGKEQAALRDVYARSWAVVCCELALRREKFAYVLSCCSTAAGQTYFSDAVDMWPACHSAAQNAIGMLLRGERVAAPALSVNLLREQLERAAKAHAQAAPLLDRQRSRRRVMRADTAELLRDRERLLAWCVEQRGTLEVLHNLADLKEFCASFQSNVAVMDTNFLVLLERGERLAQNRAVRAALLEVNRAWMELSVAVCYKITCAIDQERIASNVEKSCRWWTEQFAPRLKVILVEARTIANHHLMESKSAMQQLNEQSTAFLRSLGDSQVLLHHISDFTVRKDCLEPHEEALRTVLLAPLSLISQTFSGNAKYDGQQEYVDRLTEISEWMEAQVSNNTYAQLMRRVEKMRWMVEEQLRLLPETKGSIVINS